MTSTTTSRGWRRRPAPRRRRGQRRPTRSCAAPSACTPRLPNSGVGGEVTSSWVRARRVNRPGAGTGMIYPFVKLSPHLSKALFSSLYICTYRRHQAHWLRLRGLTPLLGRPKSSSITLRPPKPTLRPAKSSTLTRLASSVREIYNLGQKSPLSKFSSSHSRKYLRQNNNNTKDIIISLFIPIKMKCMAVLLFFSTGTFGIACLFQYKHLRRLLHLAAENSFVGSQTMKNTFVGQ